MEKIIDEKPSFQQVEEYIKRKFSEYYLDNSQRIMPPLRMEKREYGFLLFREKIMVRHRAFQAVNELRRFVENTIPSDAYHSTAYYEKPAEEMENKGWNGSDLCFDIDADHIRTPCKEIHDTWLCKSCGTAEKGEAPANCPKCQSTKIEQDTWLCEQCLEKAKDEVMKLIEILTGDFGLSTKEMHVNFSGHRGYHLHVLSDEVITLNDNERKEIVDYVLGLGLDPIFHGLHERGVEREIIGPQVTDPGWRGRLARGVYDTLISLGITQPSQAKDRTAKLIAQQREVIQDWLRGAGWGAFSGIGIKTWKKIIEKAVSEAKLGARIDTVVTTDIHRLIRLTETLNGKTGLRVVEADIGGLEAFDPFKQALAMRGEETVQITEAPQFRLGEETFGPYKEQKETLPAYAALLLVCKGKATPVTN